MTNLLQFPVQRKERLNGSFIRELAQRPCDLSLNPDVDAGRAQHLQEWRNDGGIAVRTADVPQPFGGSRLQFRILRGLEHINQDRN